MRLEGAGTQYIMETTAASKQMRTDYDTSSFCSLPSSHRNLRPAVVTSGRRARLTVADGCSQRMFAARQRNPWAPNMQCLRLAPRGSPKRHSRQTELISATGIQPLNQQSISLAATPSAEPTLGIQQQAQTSPVLSVNYHISRRCNYSCGFCFHTAKNDDILSLEDAKRGMILLRERGTQKVNFAGGEPFIHPYLLGELTRFCKLELGMATSIISNGSLIRAEWMERYGPCLDLLGLSVDSFSEKTNKAIGRGRGGHLSNVFLVRGMCEALGVKFKMNTVVNALNHDEDMNEHIALLQPSRWKVFQVLLLDGENSGQTAEGGASSLLDAAHLAVTDRQFEAFLERHAQQPQLVPESNALMQSSYLLLDEKMRFLDCSTGSKIPGHSILEVGVETALTQAGFDFQAFVDRGGIYQWRK